MKVAFFYLFLVAAMKSSYSGYLDCIQMVKQRVGSDGERIEAKRFGVTMPDKVPMTTRERAYTSPIWYSPSKATQSEN